jgi:hypothetical protein
MTCERPCFIQCRSKQLVLFRQAVLVLEYRVYELENRNTLPHSPCTLYSSIVVLVNYQAQLQFPAVFICDFEIENTILCKLAWGK